MIEIARSALAIAKEIHSEIPERGLPPEEGALPATQQVLPHSIVRDTTGYIEKVVIQINGSFEHGWFDACAVMIRRLLETLIIEAFECHDLAHKAQGPSGDFLFLGDLVSRTLSEPSWNLGRNTKKALPKLKDVGDKSAHSRRFTAHRADILSLVPDLRVAVQELVYLAKLK